MRSGRRARLVLLILLGLGAWMLAAMRIRDATRVSFSRDIAPIGLAHCAPCHRPGQSGPFQLLDYQDYRAHAADIAWAVEDRYMPPWKPAARDRSLIGDRSLEAAQIALILRWVEQGMPEGDRADLPRTPDWPKGYHLGQPDAVVRLPVAYELGPSGPDEYRNFVIPSPFRELRYVTGWEFKPGGRAIHHAILRVDRLGQARHADAADPLPGFAAMQFDGAQAPDGFYLVWAPGKTPTRVVDGTAWRLDAVTDLVLEIHMQRTGKPETVAPEIALYLSPTAPKLSRYSLRIGDWPIDIPAGVKDYKMRDSDSLPAAVRVLGLFPHAHYVARQMHVWSRLPDGKQLELLRIDDWDFNWQDEYTFVDPPSLPQGSTLEMEFVYDNSAENVRNPNQPPRRVRDGTQSTDEMGNVTFQLLPEQPGEMDRLLRSKYRRQIERGAGAEAHYNLANTLSRSGDRAGAVAEYEAALALNPELASAHYNLANALVAGGALQDALPHLRIALELAPQNPQARSLLGHTLLQLGKVVDAIGELQTALKTDPQDATANALLGDALRERGELDAARVHYLTALERQPRFEPALRGLAALGGSPHSSSVVDRAANPR